MTKINLDDWVLSGEGGEGYCYFQKDDDKLMLKVFNDLTNQNKIQLEFNASRIFTEYGISTPKAYEIVEVGDKQGILYERIKDKKSLNRLMCDDPSTIEKYSRLHANVLKEIHQIKCDKLPKQSDNLKRIIPYIESLHVISDKQLSTLNKLLEVCDSDTLMVGDAHPGNIIVANDTPYYIDLGGVRVGDYRNDLSNWYAECNHLLNEETCIDVFHLNYEQIEKCWYYFIREYLNTNDADYIHGFEEELKLFASMSIIGVRVFRPEAAGDPELLKWLGE